MPRMQNLAKLLLVAGLAAVGLALPQAASAGSYKVLEKFAGAQGKYPSGSLIADSAGNLYGVTSRGGSKACKHGGCGVVYRIAPDGTFTVLYAFQGCSNGCGPNGNLLLDAKSNLYGTTCCGGAFDDGGTVFRLAPDGTETVLYSFGAFNGDGITPHAGLIADAAGNLYGTTVEGGTYNDEGAIFRLAPDGTETILYSFCSMADCADGRNPEARLFLNGAGDLYGTTHDGGAFDAGTVFKIARDGTFSVIYSFGTSPDDGGLPVAGLIADSAGNLYGTTQATAFGIAPDGTLTTLHFFHSFSTDGSHLQSELLLDVRGNLFGTAFQDGQNGGGTVFEISAKGHFTVMHDFALEDKKGSGPNTALVPLNGYLYGTTGFGGGHGCNRTGCGVVYQLTP